MSVHTDYLSGHEIHTIKTKLLLIKHPLTLIFFALAFIEIRNQLNVRVIVMERLTTEQILIERYQSPLLRLTDLAELLYRSEDGLRMSLHRDTELSRQLKAARVKIGRRVYFRIHDVARIIDGESCEAAS